MPNEMPLNTGSEIQTFIENTLKEIKTGINNAGYVIDGAVNFNLEVTEKKEVEGVEDLNNSLKLEEKKKMNLFRRLIFQ